MEMYGKSPEHCGEFWRAVQEIWLKLYGSNMVVVAAINVRLDERQKQQSEQRRAHALPPLFHRVPVLQAVVC